MNEIGGINPNSFDKHLNNGLTSKETKNGERKEVNYNKINHPLEVIGRSMVNFKGGGASSLLCALKETGVVSDDDLKGLSKEDMEAKLSIFNKHKNMQKELLQGFLKFTNADTQEFMSLLLDDEYLQGSFEQEEMFDELQPIMTSMFEKSGANIKEDMAKKVEIYHLAKDTGAKDDVPLGFMIYANARNFEFLSRLIKDGVMQNDDSWEYYDVISDIANMGLSSEDEQARYSQMLQIYDTHKEDEILKCAMKNILSDANGYNQEDIEKDIEAIKNFASWVDENGAVKDPKAKENITARINACNIDFAKELLTNKDIPEQNVDHAIDLSRTQNKQETVKAKREFYHAQRNNPNMEKEDLIAILYELTIESVALANTLLSDENHLNYSDIASVIYPGYNPEDNKSVFETRLKLYNALKNDKDDPGVKSYRLRGTLAAVNPQNGNFILELLEDDFFPNDKISYLQVRERDEEARQKLVDTRKFVFETLKKENSMPPEEIADTVCAVKSYNADFALTLLGDETFPNKYIKKAMNEHGSYTELQELFNEKAKAYNFIKSDRADFTAEDTASLLYKISPSNFQNVYSLLQNKDLKPANINAILTGTPSSQNGKEAMQTGMQILDLINEKGGEKAGFDNDTTAEILKHTNQYTAALAKILIEDDTFPKKSIPFILERCYGSESGVKQYVEPKINFYNFAKSKENYSPERLLGILHNINSDNLSFAKEFYDSDNISKDTFVELLRDVDGSNSEFAKILASDKTFPENMLGRALTAYGSDEEKAQTFEKRIEFYNFAKNNSNISPDMLGVLLYQIDPSNVDFAKTIALDCDLKGYSGALHGILKNSSSKNPEERTNTSCRAELHPVLKDRNIVPRELYIYALNAISAANFDLAKTLINDKNFRANSLHSAFPNFSKEEDTKAVANSRLQFHEFIKTLPKDTQGAYSDVYQHICPENLDFAKTLIKDGMYQPSLIPGIMKGVSKKISYTSPKLDTERLDTAKRLYDIGKKSSADKNDIEFALINGDKQKAEFFETILADKQFPKGKLSKIGRVEREFDKDLTQTLNARFAIYKMLRNTQNLDLNDLADIMANTNKLNSAFALKYAGNKDIDKKALAQSLSLIDKDNTAFAEKLFETGESIGISSKNFPLILQSGITEDELLHFAQNIDKKTAQTYMGQDIITAIKFADIYKRGNINEVPQEDKRHFLKSLVGANTDLFNISPVLKKDFPLIPQSTEEYCTLLPLLVRSLGIETKPLDANQTQKFEKDIARLGDVLKTMSEADFNDLEITQPYTKEDFIKDVLSYVSALSDNERQKVYDYFGFELKENPKSPSKYTIIGYPANLNNGKKLAMITDENTRKVVEELRNDVVRKFAENNPVQCSDKKTEKILNDILEALPELRPAIGKVQSEAHGYDIFKHSLKVVQKIVQQDGFNQLNDSDKKVIILAALLHDITKKEGSTDATHPSESSFDALFVTKKFNLSKDEEIKLFTLISSHEWLAYVNTAPDEKTLTERIHNVSYDLRHDNLFDMSLMFTHADLRAVRAHDDFHDKKEGKGRKVINGEKRSFGESAEIYAGKSTDDVTSNTIRGCINELKKSQPLLPVTKFPTASRIKEAITEVHPDGSTNIKGVYKDGDLVVLKFNEVENWEEIGFPKGSVSKGIKGKNDLNDTEIDTGNIKFFIHGLDYPNQLAKFDAFALLDSDALLSVSYAERPESKFRFFRPQGVILNVNTKYIHGGGNTDAGSGCGKSIDKFKNDYLFGAYREKDRLYVSNLIKEATGMNDEEYIKFTKENENKSFEEIQPEETRNKIIKAFANINSNKRKGNREYNEMYISNPEPPMGVFVYNPKENVPVGNPIEFINEGAVEPKDPEDNLLYNTGFLKKYATEHDVPFVVFGD